jgi:2-oxoacid:acceptor oxidoreductase delta subunit (pyruvate/2-ketoisovalerate family)
MVKKKETWKTTTITGRMNSVPLSEVYGEEWERKVIEDSFSRNMGSWRVFVPKLDISKCKKCWLCYDFCPEGVIIKTDEGPKIFLNLCKGCGVCATECPFGAITMERE